MTGRAESSQAFEEYATAQLPVFKALADPVRLKIVVRLACGDDESVCACSMPDAFGVSQPTLSHHLKKLVAAGILNREMRGNWAHFSLRPETLSAVQSFLAALVGEQE